MLQIYNLYIQRNYGIFGMHIEIGQYTDTVIDPFHVYVNEVELEDKTITRSDV